MFWLFMGVGFFCLFMWGRVVYGNRERWEEASAFRAALRLGRLNGQTLYWQDEERPVAGVFHHVCGVDRDLLCAFNRGRVEGWNEAAELDIQDSDLIAEIREAS